MVIESQYCKSLTPLSGNGCGSIAEYAFDRKSWFRKRELFRPFLSQDSSLNLYSSDGRHRVCHADFSLFR